MFCFFRSLSEEKAPEFWPAQVSYKTYKSPSYSKMKVNKTIIKAILEFYDYNLEIHCQQPPREERMKKRTIKKKVNKKSQEEEDQMEDEVNREPAVEEEQEQENDDNLDNLVYEEWRGQEKVVEQELVDKEPVEQEFGSQEPGGQEFVEQEPGEQDPVVIPTLNGKKKKTSPIAAIRKSHRARKRPSSHVNFVGQDSDEESEDVTRRKTKRKKTAMRSLTPPPKGDYEKARDRNVAQKTKLYSDLNFSEELDKIAEEMDL